ncbi:hypothetical protein K439DRAFT_1663766 [Ramaria rubella]|nr:hypothetical protein K439DRAFT_1663766 [Ramaria rubella]
MSVRSPPIPGGGFRIPPAPENPPTLDDVSNAVQYTREMLTAGGQGVVRKQDVAHAYIYQTAVLNAQLKANDIANAQGQDDPPPWYTAGQETIQKALSALEKKVDGIETGIGGRLDRLGKTVNEAVQKVDGMERKVSRLDEKVDQLTRKVDGLEQTVNGVSCLTAQLWNIQCESGIARPFKVISFPDGSLPTDVQHKLPALLKAQDVERLTAQQCTKYLNGYGLPVHVDVTDWKRAIALEIGCTQLVL